MKKYVIGMISVLFLHFFLLGLDSPEKFLGFKPGTDGRLVHYNQVKDYFLKVGEESPRVDVQLIGKTTLNKDMVMAVISSEENLKNIAAYKEISRQLSMATVGEQEARELAARGKVVVFVTCNLHADEIGSSQMALDLLYFMATDDSREIKHILHEVIFVFMPSVNPDGQAMVVEWYEKYRGTKFEGSDLPYIYHYYAGHDNNRDWFKFNLKETWLVSRELYFNWFPQILVDEHQMGESGDRFFVPPYADPPTPGVHPLVWRMINMIGANISYELEKRNYQGVASRGYFQGWWIGALDDCAWFHNIPGVLFEAASVKVASPIYVEPEEVESGVSRENGERMFSPNPWKGGWWRLKDIMNYDYYGTLSVLKTAAMYREELLWNSYQMARDSIAAGKNQAPFAYVIPHDQLDPMTVEKYIKTLLKSNIQVYCLTAPLQIGNSYFETGSFVIPLAQPYRSFVKNILAYQRYPDIRNNPKDEKILPYDGAGWTLHLGMGVKAVEIEKVFEAPMKPVGMDDVFKRDFPANLGEYIVLEPQHNNTYAAVATLLKKGIPVWRNLDSDQVARGAFIVKAIDSLETLKEINDSLPLVLESFPAEKLALNKFKKLKSFKVALFQNYGHNMEEGWTRYVFDEFKIDYENIHIKDFEKKNYLSKYDVIVFTGASKTEIETGTLPKKWEQYYTPMPPEYSGGIDKKGKTALEEYLKSGKTIIFIGESCEYALENFKLPVEDGLKDGAKERVFCPGSYLQAEVKETELTFGMPARVAVFCGAGPVFSAFTPRDYSQERRTPLVFGLSDLLLSGALEGEENLARKALVVDIKTHGGRIILVGPNLMFRAQTEGVYKIIFNALFTAAR